MSQFIVNCPGCQQPLQCEETWAGQTIQCPSCQAALIVPGPATPPPGAPVKAPPKSKFAGSASAGTLKSKKSKGKPPMTLQKGLGIFLIVLVCGAGAVFGFKLIMKMQDKMNAADRRERELSGGGESQGRSLVDRSAGDRVDHHRIGDRGEDLPHTKGKRWPGHE